MSNDLIPTQDEVKAIEIMSKHAVESKFVEKLGGYAGVFSIAMYAREIGVPVMMALFGGMANIMGKITIAPQLMNAMIRKAGHKMDIDSNEVRCIIKGTRKDTGECCTASFSVEEARKAGLYKEGGGWSKYPSDMCFARALSRLARRLFPDVIGMAYVEGEIEEDDKKTKPSKGVKTSISDETPDTINIESVNDLPLNADQLIQLDLWCSEFPDFKKGISDRYKKQNLYLLTQNEFKEAEIMIGVKRKAAEIKEKA